MALNNADRIKETTTTTGTGTYSLNGAVTGFHTFVAGVGTTNTCTYVVEDGNSWEVGIGTVTSGTPNTLSRDEIITSSNAGAAVNWGAGSKNVFCSPNARHDTSLLQYHHSLVPTAPTANRLKMYARNRSGRMFPEMIGPSGLDTSLQPALFGNSVTMWLPGTGTTAAINFSTSWTVAVTQSHPALATGSLMNQMKRAVYTTTATAGNASGVRSAATICWTGNAAGQGGFFFFARFGVVTLQASMQIWCGLSASNALLAGEPSAQNNTVALVKDQADTNWFIAYRDGATTNRVATGIAVAANDIFDVMFFCPPNGTSITSRIVRINDGTVLSDNVANSTNIPVNTAFLYPHVECRTNAASAVAIALNRIYIESDT